MSSRRASSRTPRREGRNRSVGGAIEAEDSGRVATVADIARLLDTKLGPLTSKIDNLAGTVDQHSTAITTHKTNMETLAKTVEGALTLAQGTAQEVMEIKKKIDAQIAKPVLAVPPSRVLTLIDEGDEIREIAKRMRIEIQQKLTTVGEATSAVDEAFMAVLNSKLDDLGAEVEKVFHPAHLQGSSVVIVKFQNAEVRKQTYNEINPFNQQSKRRTSELKYNGEPVVVKMLRTQREQKTINALYSAKSNLTASGMTELIVNPKDQTVVDKEGKVVAEMRGGAVVTSV